MPSPSLPNDIAALQALLLQRDEQLVQLRETVSTLELALSVRTLEIEQLKLQIAKLKRMQFGRKSEKIDRKIKQLETRLEDLIAEEGAAEQKQPTAAIPGQKSVHQPLPEHLVREEHIIEPEEQACPQCAGNLKPLGRRLGAIGIIDAAFKVIRHVRRKKPVPAVTASFRRQRRAARLSVATLAPDCSPISPWGNTRIIYRCIVNR